MGIIIDDLDESEYGVAGYGEMSARLDAAEQQVKSLTAQLASAKEERDVLGQAIGEAVVKAGIANGVPMTGPELLLMLDGVVPSLAAAKEEGAALIESQMQRAEAAEAALSAERKETERLREALGDIAEASPYQDKSDLRAIAQAALQERQGATCPECKSSAVETSTTKSHTRTYDAHSCQDCGHGWEDNIQERQGEE